LLSPIAIAIAIAIRIMSILSDINASLSGVEQEIVQLERSLAGAKRRKNELLEQQQRAEEQQRQAEQRAAEQRAAEEQKRQQAQAKSAPAEADIADYEARIADLKRQIAQADADKSAAHAEDEYEEEEILEEYYEEEYYEEEEIIEDEEEVEYEEVEYEVEEDHAKHSDTSAAVHAQAQTNPSARDYAEVRQDQLDHNKTQNQWAKPNYGPKSKDVQSYGNHQTPGHTHLVDKSDALKAKYQFEKPAWASQGPAANTKIDNTSIQNPLLKKNQGSGYTRQVFAKEKQAKSKGTFVAKRTDAPPPRLAWIVVDINKRKAGKIVLHLYGQGTEAVVEQFPKLTGMSLERNGTNRPICVEELLDPKFYITTNSTTKGLENKKDTYGLVQEGKEIIAAIKKADEHASITIRQSHVFPVKKAKA
jgi:hypothetical protein